MHPAGLEMLEVLSQLSITSQLFQLLSFFNNNKTTRHIFAMITGINKT